VGRRWISCLLGFFLSARLLRKEGCSVRAALPSLLSALLSILKEKWSRSYGRSSSARCAEAAGSTRILTQMRVRCQPEPLHVVEGAGDPSTSRGSPILADPPPFNPDVRTRARAFLMRLTASVHLHPFCAMHLLIVSFVHLSIYLSLPSFVFLALVPEIPCG
jgi:hypothetical protein